MGLLEELRAVEPGYNGITNWTVLDAVDGIQEVDNDFVGDGRWENFYVSVFRRGDEYVALHYSEPATEMQEGQDQSVAEFYTVVPRTETVEVTRYDKVES